MQRFLPLAGLLAVLAAPVAAAAPDLPAPLERALADPELRGRTAGVLVQEVGGGEPLVALAPDRPLRPASAMKLLTTACALERLGPAWQAATVFAAAGRPDAAGRITGDLWVRAGGSPLLRAEDLWAALRQLAARGLRHVGGDVVIDVSLFDDAHRPGSWPARRVIDPYDAPQGAFSVGWNSLAVIVRPGAAPGAPAEVSTFPLAAVARVVNRVRTGQRTAIDIVLATPEGDPGRITVSGTIAAGAAPRTEWVHLGDPDAIGRAALVELLEDVGIAVAGTVRTGLAPPAERTKVLLRHDSPPLAEIVAAVNKYSSNFGAEMLVRLLAAAEEPDRPASTAGGLAVIGSCLAGWGAPLDGVALHDGSGYARANRLAPRTLVAVLEAAVASPDWGPELLVSLPRAGEDGSLKRRLPQLRGRLRAKTGSLRDVAALAGRAITPGGRTVTFALIVNEGAGASRVAPAAADRLLVAALHAADEVAARREQRPTAAE
jgi:D-alanyl-D-alanine carboxypeptidase/D-alanyl-D-alanine-endopeptidase (penicillin-binding protein 4)